MPNGLVSLLISNAPYKIGDRIKPEDKKATTLYSYLDPTATLPDLIRFD
jgi:hypothetical protein